MKEALSILFFMNIISYKRMEGGNTLGLDRKHQLKRHHRQSSEHEHHSSEKCQKCCDHKDNCKSDCLCQFLDEFQCEEVTITTKTGEVISGQLKRVKDCCVKIIQPGSMSPFVSKRITIIRCKDIESFSVDFFSS